MRRTTASFTVAVLLLSTLAAPTAFAGGGKAGWGGGASFIGRYRAKVLDGGAGGVRGGELTMFVQEEFAGSTAPAGILKLRTETNTDVVYLVELTHRGRERGALVKGGSFLGPTIGRFVGRMPRPGRLAAAVTTRGLGTVKLRFARYSRKAAP